MPDDPTPIPETDSVVTTTATAGGPPDAPLNETKEQWRRRQLEEFLHFSYSNTDKILLLIVLTGLVGVMMHAIHHGMDKEHVRWFEGIANTVSGTLIGIITGTRLGMAMAKTETKTDKK